MARVSIKRTADERRKKKRKIIDKMGEQKKAKNRFLRDASVEPKAMAFVIL